MREEVEVPDWAYQAKPWFPDRESAFAVLAEIREWIKAGNEPHLWRGHTHTPPPAGGRVEYLDEFDLPQRSLKMKFFAACPCCSPHHRKYDLKGKVAYFPDEQVIRILGPDCFSAIDEHGHRDAMKELRDRRQRELDASYLLSNLWRVPKTLHLVEHAQPVGEAIDTVRQLLDNFVHSAVGVRLWEHLKDGSLRYTQTFTNIRRLETEDDDDKEEKGTPKSGQVRVYGTIAGYRMFRPRPRSISVQLAQAVGALQKINFGTETRDIILNMSDDDRNEAVKLLNQSASRSFSAWREIEDLKQFFTPTTIATLNGWANHEGSPVRFHCILDGRNFCIGYSEHSHRRFEVPAAFFQTVGRLPDFMARSAAA